MSLYYRGGLGSRLGRILNAIAHSFYWDYNNDVAKSVLVCGAGRSGTTWLAETINATNEFRYLYEPFNREHVPECRYFAPFQYLRPQEDDARYLGAARAIFSGRIRNAWIDQYNRRIIVRRRLIKDVRSSLMLKWIRNHFPEMPIVFVVRHPCAVAVSRIKLGFRTDRRDEYCADRKLMADYLLPLSDEVQRADSAFERHIVDWCVSNLVPFSQLQKGDVFLAFYENICAAPEKEFERLYKYLGMAFDGSVLTRLNTPSASTGRKIMRTSRAHSAEQAVDGWRKHVSTENLAFTERITQAFGLYDIYGTSSLADVVKAEHRLERNSSATSRSLSPS